MRLNDCVCTQHLRLRSGLVLITDHDFRRRANIKTISFVWFYFEWNINSVLLQVTLHSFYGFLVGLGKRSNSKILSRIMLKLVVRKRIKENVSMEVKIRNEMKAVTLWRLFRSNPENFMMLLRSKRNQKINAYTIRKNNSKINLHLYTNNLLINLGNPRDANSQISTPPSWEPLKPRMVLSVVCVNAITIIKLW